MNMILSHTSFSKSFAPANVSQVCGYPKYQGECVEFNNLVIWKNNQIAYKGLNSHNLLKKNVWVFLMGD